VKAFAANCPSCGGPVEFSVGGSMVTICEFCQTAVARTNKKVEDHGKVADLIETRSPLAIGVSGKFRGKGFEIVGRVQYRHPAGGVWDEWYLAMPGEKIGWLAEAQGRFYLLFAKPAKVLGQIPSFDTLNLGDTFNLGKELGTITVSEKGIAKAGSAEGEIPWDFRPGAEHRFADLSGPNKTFATIDFNLDAKPESTEEASTDEGGYELKRGAVNVYIGREVTLAELGITAKADESKGVGRTETAQLNCPNCAGPLELFAPDVSERVTCPNCKALIDCRQGKLQYLETLKTKKAPKPLIPMGSRGRIDNVDWTVIGFLQRYVIYEGKRYFWTEYLLYEPTQGFRWLVNSEEHWNFVSPVPPGEVTGGGMSVNWNGQEFKLYQKGTATVGYVLGEFYWKITVGEVAETKDYIAPPQMLSFEGSSTGASSEMNISVGRYMPHEEVEAAFGLKDLPRPWSVSPNQPAPPVGSLVLSWFGFVGLLLLLYVIAQTKILTPEPDGWMLWYGLLTVSAIPVMSMLYAWSFEHRRWENSDYSPYATGD
jgi:hypothetical protein